MPAIAEPPTQSRHLPAVLRPFIFSDPERARQAGLRSAEVRRNKRLAKEQQAKPPEPESAIRAVNAQLELVAEQITHTRAVLNDDDYRYCEHCERGGIEPHHRAQLLKALDSLLDRQRKLLGIPDPGALRPGREKSRERRSYSDLSSLVVEVQSCGVPPTTNSVPSQPAKPQTTQAEQGAKAEDFSI